MKGDLRSTDYFLRSLQQAFLTDQDATVCSYIGLSWAHVSTLSSSRVTRESAEYIGSKRTSRRRHLFDSKCQVSIYLFSLTPLTRRQTNNRLFLYL